MSTADEVAGRTWADVVGAVALLRVAVRALDRLVGRASASAVHPELAMALMESSNSAQKAIVMLAEARQLLADGFPRLPLPNAMVDETVVEPAYRREDKLEMPIPAMPGTADEVFGSGLLLALVASHVRRAWHAGVMDADAAMRRLDGFLCEMCSAASASALKC